MTVQVLATNLRALRLARELTKADVAAAARIIRNHYQSRESARLPVGGPANPRLSTLLALAAVHDVPLCPPADAASSWPIDHPAPEQSSSPLHAALPYALPPRVSGRGLTRGPGRVVIAVDRNVDVGALALRSKTPYAATQTPRCYWGT